MQPYVIAAAGDRVGEGIVWVAAEGAAYWADMTGFRIRRCDLATRRVTNWDFAEPVAALALTDRPGTLLVALASKLIFWRPADDRREDHGFRTPGWPRVRLNDGRPDPAGNFWVGSMWNNIGPAGEVSDVAAREGALYRVVSNGSATEQRRGIGISNTVCWSPDNSRFYFADTLANRIWRYDYNPASGAISNEQDFFAGFDRGLPDGSCVDAEGCLWNCRYGGGCILRITPDGVLDRVVEIPTPLVTTCTFGGPHLAMLLITTGGGGPDGGDRLAGSLFGFEVSVPGLPERVYRTAAP
jgi:sugar lactone lactonase YvrE